MVQNLCEIFFPQKWIVAQLLCILFSFNFDSEVVSSQCFVKFLKSLNKKKPNNVAGHILNSLSSMLWNVMNTTVSSDK